MRTYFPRLIGNEETKRRLCRAALANTLPHAFLFVGAFGSGKHTLATELAAALNCENRTAGDTLPCHACNTCRRIENGLFADLHFIKREPRKMSVGVDEIHKMQEDIILSATESDYRIYVIEEAEKLTPQAQNAMLKTLEEPPSGVIIILLAAETDKILTTVKSRVQTVNMEKFDTDTLLRTVTERNERARLMRRTEPEKLSGILMTADGRLGRALALFDDGREAARISERREITLRLVECLKLGAPYSALYSATKELPTDRAEFTEALEDALSALRDLILLRYDGSVPLIFFTDRASAATLSEEMNVKRLFSVYDLIKSTLEDNAKNANIGAEIANLAAQIKLI